MSFVLTLVASDIPLSAGTLAQVEGLLDGLGLRRDTDPSWLDPHKAADIPIADHLLPDQILTLQTFLEPLKTDLFCLPAQNRRKRLLIADMDATIIEGETLDKLAAHCGLEDRIAAITERAMRGELDFAAALRERVALLKDLPESALHDTLATTRLNPGAERLVRTMAAHGAHCVLVSGGFTTFTAAIAARAGFQHHHGNTLHLSDGRLTGTVAEPILGREAKKEFLHHYAGENLASALAIGDGANDLDMLQAAGLGIGYYPKPLLRAAIKNHILYGDLTTALYAQGYTGTEVRALALPDEHEDTREHVASVGHT